MCVFERLNVVETPRPGATEGVAASPPRHTHTRKGLGTIRQAYVHAPGIQSTVDCSADHRVASESEAVLRPARQLLRGPGAHHAVIGEGEARFLLLGQLPRFARLFNLWGHINLP